MYLTEQALPKTTLSLEHFHVKEHSSVINIQEHQHSTFNIQDQGIVDVCTIAITRHIVVAILLSCYFWLYHKRRRSILRIISSELVVIFSLVSITDTL